ncbi:platelet binding protein GspB isoform X2 [Seriola aureovittata]|uniref:platelet binding protein GspB isoform X2 n=1 Tax=Seriola aureovittata TaxID=2871759 RepID=UPI0024BEC646|nr:platelet binding protein GspB isoform X2 [Seriola aureovittata]
MELPQRVVASPQLPADEDGIQSVGQSSINQLGPQSHRSASRDQRQSKLSRNDSELQQLERHSLEMLSVSSEFQDSNLSPALLLLPVNAGMEHNFTEYSLFQQSDNEFAPLRAYPDISMATDRFHFPLQDATTQASECGSLSQHPLAQATILSEEGASRCSLSQHSLSPGDEGRREEIVHSRLIATTDRQDGPSRDDASSKEKVSVTLTNTLDKLVGKAVEDETFFLNKDIPAQQLLEILQKDVGMPSSSSSAVSSASETSVKSIASFSKNSKSSKVCKPGIDQSMVRREGPPGEASLPQQQTKQPDRVTNPDQSRTLSSEVCNITVGSRSTQPDNSSEVLHRELLSEVERRSSHEAESKNQQWKGPSPGQCLTPYPTETSESKPSVTRTNLGGMPWTGPFSAGVERVQREQDLWSSGNQTGIDGSYLGFLPQSQSTPGVFKAPSKSNVKATFGQLSAIESSKENSYQSSTGIPSHPAVPEADVHCPDTANQCQEEHTSAKVQSLPSLNYLQKVDAWRANQSSGKTSLFDSLALQGFSGISPKKKAYDAVSDTLNRILSQQARNLQQPPVSSASNQNVIQSSSTAPSGSSSQRRGEAVGSAPSDKDNTGSAARPSASPFGRSQSHSSLSTVVMSVQKDQQTRPAEKEKSQTQDDVHHQPSTTAQPLPLISLGQFSDVSVDRDFTLSSSQDSYNSGIKLGASIGASSVTSLEVDNYAPYWTSKLSTPPPLPRPRELNIEERIPLYLHNLGIDQSPSTILTPFAPRGPIREPEFSPTDLFTIKGSIGTSTKSTQPSEGGSPHKGEFSRSSILSVDSTGSIPFSLDSLAPAVSIPEHTKRASPSTSSDTEAIQSKYRRAQSSQPDQDFLSSRLQPSQQQQKDSGIAVSQNAVQLGERFDSDLLLATKVRCGERDLESSLQMNRRLEQSAKDPFVNSKALGEIRKLLSQVEKVVSPGSSAASSASPAAPRLLSDDDIFLSLRKNTSRLQESSFSSFSATDPRTHSSLLWARSSSDSMLTSEKPRQSSIGRENLTSSWQPDYPSTQSLTTAPAAGTYKRLQDSAVSRGAGSSLVLSKSARRAEPEGCSAAPPDNKVPTQPAVIKPLPAVSTQQLTSTPTETAGVPEEEEKTSFGGPVQSSSSSPSLEDTDQGVMSDGSSDSSLAVRVAKLLQSESPATMVSSTPSITDQEENKAREWIKMKISGQQCEPLELDQEDRKRIEEIKRELLLKYPMKSQLSTDTESSAASSVRVPRGQDPPQPAETFTAHSDANNQLSQPVQGLSTNLSDSRLLLQSSLHPDLEAQVLEIAAREGVTLPRTNPRALTSITIATRKRSTSPSPSTSPAPPISPAPEPLHLTELSTGTVERPQAKRPAAQNEEDKTTREPESVFEPKSSLYTRKQSLNTQLMSGNQKRQDAVGCQFEEPPPPSQGLNREDVNAKEDNTPSFRRDDKLSIQDSSVSGSHGAEQTASSSTSGSPVRTGHVSHVHLTLSPKATDHNLAIAVHSSHADAVAGMPRREFVPLRHSPSAASSPDEGVGLSSPPEWYETPEPKRQQGHERVGASSLFKAAVPPGRKASTSKKTFTPCYRAEASQRPLTTESPAVPVLLPYKPRGSKELFYVPQAEADVSSTGPSDTTMESSHTGSDDAVPPRFSSEVLGHQDPGLDRGVTIRHTEGIYSKRLKTATFKMQAPGHRGASVIADKSSQTSLSQTPKTSSQVSLAFTRVPLSSNQESSKRDRGTSPLQFLHYNQPEPSRDRFQPVHEEVDEDDASHHLDQSPDPQQGGERDQQRRDPDVPHPASQQSNSSLDELWQKFCDRWTIEESRSTREASLLERLERLSRLIQNTRGTDMSESQDEEYHDPYSTKPRRGRRGEDATREEKRRDVREGKKSLHAEAGEWKVRGSRKFDEEPPAARQAWTQRTPEPLDQDSRTSSLSHSSSQSQHLCPADRDESETLSTLSGSMSTVDTARLIRVFGAHRVQHLKTSSSLSKLYDTINKQKDGREQRRGRNKESLSIITPSETIGTDEASVAADSASSTSTSSLPLHRGPTKTLAAKKAVKLVSKGIQTAGDLEIVSNGTRRHTRDVGTTFPSPRETRASRQISSSSTGVERGRGGRRSPSKIQSSEKQRKSKRSPSKPYPEGVSWFISADDVRSEARKENQQEEEESTWRPSTAWFEPYSRTHPWREPLRQRQSNFIHRAEPDPDLRTKTMSSGLSRVSLQEALEMRRPEFISRSTQRVKRLALQVEERKLQAVFTRERHDLFNQHGGPGRLLRPAGTALLRRAVPRKEMIQRSKLIYEKLPEVQRRREEERRKTEYRSYRLNAQLYNKRITNRVLGRQTAWQ